MGRLTAQNRNTGDTLESERVPLRPPCYIINGIFTTMPLTGIERFSFCILEALDKIAGDLDIELVLPESANCDLKYKNIKIVKYGKRNGPLWVQFDYLRYAKRKKGITVGLGSYMPFLYKNGICALHDIRDIVHKNYGKNRLMTVLSCYFRVYWSKHIVTISNFTKGEIIKKYKIPDSKISVIYIGWQHFSASEGICFDSARYPFLKEKEFYFSLGAIAKHKNLSYIVEVARRNPASTFAISGPKIDRLCGFDIDGSGQSNIHYLGYISDDDVKMMMKYCKAFIFPSLYEGFGIPPLEALSLGAPAIVSNQSALPEIYGDTVHYIDPFDYDVDLDKLLSEKVAPPDTVLDKYSFDKSAKQLYDILAKP